MEVPTGLVATEYEQAMFTRSTAEAATAARLYELMFGDNAPHSLVGRFTARA